MHLRFCVRKLKESKARGVKKINRGQPKTKENLPSGTEGRDRIF
jgi:hypothetical protein